jgi:peptide deformylase
MTEFLSKLFQHEMDHLNGILMIDEHEKIENLYPVDITKEKTKKYESLYSAYKNNKPLK